MIGCRTVVIASVTACAVTTLGGAGVEAAPSRPAASASHAGSERIEPVQLPKKAPRPRIRLPQQPRPTAHGMHPRVMRIPGKVWRSMTGRSWHRGCPVGRKQLRLVRMNYWGYDGYRHRGELVVHRSIARNTVRAFRAIYRGKFPIRHMFRVDRFGWSRKLHGANDFKSMRAGNTSAFNCRGIVGRPNDLSPHSLGRSIDINTWENPYRSARGFKPNRWWNFRSRPHRITYRSAKQGVVRAMRGAGFGWLGSADWQHFQIDPSGRAHRHDGGIFGD
ncbi:M15 family metallopeptidase [Nocardioidaceae bacterium SCSIO 66511]|nr:M15 family metallopeptidase [Nocardioidaceae bacterium SCSIO 66511]